MICMQAVPSTSCRKRLPVQMACTSWSGRVHKDGGRCKRSAVGISLLTANCPSFIQNGCSLLYPLPRYFCIGVMFHTMSTLRVLYDWIENYNAFPVLCTRHLHLFSCSESVAKRYTVGTCGAMLLPFPHKC